MTEPAPSEGAAGRAAAELGLDARLERLEEVVRQLERDDQDLEAALRLFEEGVEHVRAARAALARSELAIETLVAEAAGEFPPRGPSAGGESAGAAGGGSSGEPPPTGP